MGKSLPPPAAIDLVGSYARKRGSDAEAVMWDPKLATTSGTLVLRKGRSAVEGSIELVEDAAGRRMVGRAPLAKLSDGIWSMVLRTAEGDDEPVDARLLVQGARPLVLLWGAKTQPSLVPAPRRAGAQVTGRKKAAKSAGKALDRALKALPPERARAVRTRARRIARRVLK